MPLTRRVCTPLFILLACVGPPQPTVAQPAANPVTAKVTETRIGPWPKGLGNPEMTPDGLHVAYAIQADDGTGTLLVHDDKVDAGVTKILSQLELSPDGTRLAYVAGRGKKAVVVLDGVASREWNDLDPTSLRFSPDGKHFSYRAYEGKKSVVITDGVAGPPYDFVDAYGVVYNSTSDRFAYLAADRGRSFAVVDGVPDSSFDELTSGVIAWSPDGKRLAYSAKRGRSWILRVDGKPGPRYRALAPPVFSADGNHVSFWAVDDGAAGGAARVLVRDGVIVAKVEGLANLCLSPDGSRIAYMEQIGQEWTIVVDGVRGPAFEGIPKHFPLEFSPDGRHVAYVGVKSGRHQLVVDGEVRASHDIVGGMRPGAVLRRGAEHLSYAAADGGKWKVFHEAGIGPEYDRILLGGPTVQADGVAEYLAVRSDTLFRVRQEPGTP